MIELIIMDLNATLRIMKLSKSYLIVTLGITTLGTNDNQHNNIKHKHRCIIMLSVYRLCHCTECRNLDVTMLSVVVLNVRFAYSLSVSRFHNAECL
jgi:hypothetical protein